MMPDGYTFQYTWWQDFTIADAFGAKAIKDTYKRAFAEWHDDRVAMQEMTVVLNWKCWEHYEKKHEDISILYRDLYEDCYDKCLNHFKGEELTAYWEFLD